MARLVWLGCLAYLVVGLGQLVVGTVMEPMVHAYGIGYGDGGQLVMHQFLGAMTGTLAAPWLMRIIGRKALLLGALALMGIGQLVYTLQPSWAVMLTVGPFVGFGFGVTEATVGAFIIGAAREKANTAMNRVEVFFGLGAFLMPFAGAALIQAGNWKMAFALVGVLAAVAVVVWFLLWPSAQNEGEEAAGGKRLEPASQGVSPPAPLPASPPAGRPATIAALTLLAGCLFFGVYVGFEMSFVHYLPSLLVLGDGVGEAEASLSLSAYWAAMAAGRLLSGHLADRWGGGTYLLATCAACAALFGGMGFGGGVGVAFTLTTLIGLVMSGMFAVALVYINRAVPGQTARTTSLVMASGGIGGALLPKLSGWYLDQFGVDSTRWLFAAMAVAMLAVAAWLLGVARQARRARSGSAS